MLSSAFLTQLRTVSSSYVQRALRWKQPDLWSLLTVLLYQAILVSYSLLKYTRTTVGMWSYVQVRTYVVYVCMSMLELATKGLPGDTWF